MELSEFFDRIVEGTITKSTLASLVVGEGAECGEILQVVMWCRNIQMRGENENPPSVNFRSEALCSITRHFLTVKHRDLGMAREVARKSPNLGWKTRAWLLIYEVARENGDLEEANVAQELLEAQSCSHDILHGLKSLRCRVLKPTTLFLPTSAERP